MSSSFLDRFADGTKIGRTNGNCKLRMESSEQNFVRMVLLFFGCLQRFLAEAAACVHGKMAPKQFIFQSTMCVQRPLHEWTVTLSAISPSSGGARINSRRTQTVIPLLPIPGKSHTLSPFTSCCVLEWSNQRKVIDCVICRNAQTVLATVTTLMLCLKSWSIEMTESEWFIAYCWSHNAPLIENNFPSYSRAFSQTPKKTLKLLVAMNIADCESSWNTKAAAKKKKVIFSQAIAIYLSKSGVGKIDGGQCKQSLVAWYQSVKKPQGIHERRIQVMIPVSSMLQPAQLVSDAGQ